jgi:hypothetical protein
MASHYWPGKASAAPPYLKHFLTSCLPPEASAKATAVAEWETNQELLEYAANDRTLDVCPDRTKGLESGALSSRHGHS